MTFRQVIIEADGGSRGNPGPAAYGSLLRDAITGDVIAERAEFIGVASNNVAEYRGLIAGLELVRDHAPDADVEVRMDSKLVIEQMAGRWKIKHPDMADLANRARPLVPTRVTWTWVPRDRNKAADALANAAMDAAEGKTPVKHSEAPVAPAVGWQGDVQGPPTTFVMLRHGVTDHTVRKLFSGSGGSDPGLNPDGFVQARRAADWINHVGDVAAIVSSPMRRTRETAGEVAEKLGLDVTIEQGVIEAAFGDWEGHSFADITQKWPAELQAWLDSTAVAPPGGETFDAVYERVRATRDRLLEQYAGQTIVVVSHVTPIKMLVRMALDAPMPVIYKMELAPASISTAAWWPDGVSSLRNFSLTP